LPVKNSVSAFNNISKIFENAKMSDVESSNVGPIYIPKYYSSVNLFPGYKLQNGKAKNKYSNISLKAFNKINFYI